MNKDQEKRMAPYPFNTPEEHELAVALVPPRGSTGNTYRHIIPCAECHTYFRTTDWPPVLCRDCRLGIKPEDGGN